MNTESLASIRNVNARVEAAGGLDGLSKVPEEVRRAVLDTPVILPDGRTVTFGEMTIEDHEVCIKLLKEAQRAV